MPTRIVPAILVLLAVFTFLARADEQPVSADFSFLSGTWRMQRGSTTVEETWTSNVGGIMLGVSRTMRGERTVFFEFLRIEKRADGATYYVAQPRGNPPTDFKLTSVQGGTVTFENPSHDFPQKIVYERVSDDTLRARISGPRNGKDASESWEFQRIN
jgi:hypothetical protein